MTAWLTAHQFRAMGTKVNPADVNPYTRKAKSEATIKVPVRALKSIFCG